MKVTGMTRKIDDLGRIVIPKGIRNALNINSGDDFQISIIEEKIILEKYSKLTNFNSKIDEMLINFNFLNNMTIKIIVNNKLLNTDITVNNSIVDIIQERKMYVKLNLDKLNISKNIEISDNAVINPIVLNSDLLGAVIIYGKESIDNMILVSKIICNLIKNMII